MSRNVRSRPLDELSVVSRRYAADRRRVLVATVPERIAEFGRTWERLGGDWTPLFDDLAVLVRHMRRTVGFGAEQAVRLREGRV
ncbi:hypothetical protein ACWGH3_21630 [Streptomyces sp. NPDC054884]|uniref:hypothetical protein n=1 Tax=Streptomyces sp. ME08-AFT2 TaxID=3028683 RepID=UPI0039F6D59F